MEPLRNNTKRYNDYSSYIRSIFPGRTQKISVDASFTCPNRDGSKSYAGCTYCNNNSFKPSYCKPVKSITEQVEEGIAFFSKRKKIDQFLAYFQAFSNTYSDLETLREKYLEALSVKDVKGLVISTRPDCLDKNTVQLLEELTKSCYVSLEIGIESCYDDTLNQLNRCHTFETTRRAFELCRNKNFDVGGHLILGLPGETKEMMLNQADIISDLGLKTIKIHQLQIIGKTVLAKQFADNPSSFQFFTVGEYSELIVHFLERLDPKIVVERFASQSPYDLLIFPKWGLKNFEIAFKIEKELEKNDTFQGKNFRKKYLLANQTPALQCTS